MSTSEKPGHGTAKGGGAPSGRITPSTDVATDTTAAVVTPEIRLIGGAIRTGAKPIRTREVDPRYAGIARDFMTHSEPGTWAAVDVTRWDVKEIRKAVAAVGYVFKTSGWSGTVYKGVVDDTPAIVMTHNRPRTKK